METSKSTRNFESDYESREVLALGGADSFRANSLKGGAEALCTSLMRHPTLHTLVLAATRLEASAGAPIGALLHANTRITHLDVPPRGTPAAGCWG